MDQPLYPRYSHRAVTSLAGNRSILSPTATLWDELPLITKTSTNPVKPSSSSPPQSDIAKSSHSPLPSSPYVDHTNLWYLATLLPVFLIVVSSFAFLFHQYLYGAVAAPRAISSWTLSNPRQTTQIAAIIASALTASIRWSLGISAVQLAQKRFLHQFRPVFEMEAFTAIKNIAIVWDWKHHKRMLIFSWLTVAICGFLTSGFVALITPFPIALSFEIQGITELDFASTDESCLSWFQMASNRLWEPLPSNPQRPTCHDIVLDGFSLTSCRTTRHLPQLLSAISATVLGYFADSLPPNKHASFVTPYPTLNNTRILGGTAGTLPIGPAGIQAFPFPSLTDISGDYNYTLKLQGVWLDGSCAYDKDSQLRTFPEQGTDKLDPAVRIACPMSGDFIRYPLDPEDLHGTTIAHVCSSANVLSVYWRSFDRAGASTGDSMDLVRCDFAPKIGEVDAILSTSISAFKMVKGPNATSPSNTLGLEMVKSAIQEVDRATRLSNTPAGNLLIHVVRGLALSYGRMALDDWLQPNDIIPTLLGLLFQGAFEFEMSDLRLMYTAMSSGYVPAPPACLRPVEGEMIERMAGWNIQRSTVLGLVPLVLIAVITFTILAQSIWIPGELTQFDPTSPVSVLAATSAGKIRFSNKSRNTPNVGSPNDEQIGNAEVKFTNRGDGVWAFKLKAD